MDRGNLSLTLTEVSPSFRADAAALTFHSQEGIAISFVVTTAAIQEVRRALAEVETFLLRGSGRA
jgi:hypothetical protein